MYTNSEYVCIALVCCGNGIVKLQCLLTFEEHFMESISEAD